MSNMFIQFSGFVFPESDNDEYYNDKLLREYDRVAEQIRMRIETGIFYESGLLLDLLTI